MSGYSYSRDCPNCDGKDTLMVSEDSRPHETISGECIRCGYYFYTANGFMTRKELDKVRKNYDRKPRIFKGKNKMEKW